MVDDPKRKAQRLEEIKKSIRFDEAVAQSSIMLSDCTKEEVSKLDLEVLIRRVKNNINARIGGKVI